VEGKAKMNLQIIGNSIDFYQDDIKCSDERLILGDNDLRGK
jgi:hypothetical protein